MKYKVGDRVTVVDQETLRDAMILHGYYPGYADTDAYGRFCGQIVTIAEIDDGGSYLIEEYLEKSSRHNCWTDECFRDPTVDIQVDLDFFK